MLELKNVSKAYLKRDGHELRVLDRITFSVAPGQFVALVGASGCGKTTLLRVLAGLERLDDGIVTMDESGEPKLTKASMVFQGDALLPWRTVLSNIAFGLERDRSISRGERRNRARRLCKLVGLQGFEGAYPYEISGGMQQRVNIARALAVEPLILLMDEPFAALDAQTREVMQQELLKIWERDKKTVVFVTHQMDEAVYLADRVIVLRSRPGRIALDLDVPFARPRPLQLKHSHEFADLVAQVWSKIQEDVLAASRFGSGASLNSTDDPL
jgi:ABC-type nitrate/sulfonate/bicarbonate transport system ATPase subunit